jgi:uncharacterized protein
MSLQNGHIYVAPSTLHGTGVFASQDIEVGDMIEICPVLLFPKEQLVHFQQTVLDDYYFDWGDNDDFYAIALGYGSLYNHSYVPNAEYDMDFDSNTIDIHCIKPISAGHEIFINYNGYPEDQTPVWFEKTDSK